jgi:hypothetical protein
MFLFLDLFPFDGAILAAQSWAIFMNGRDRDLGGAVLAQIIEVCDRPPAEVAHAALVRGGILEA